MQQPFERIVQQYDPELTRRERLYFLNDRTGELIDDPVEGNAEEVRDTNFQYDAFEDLSLHIIHSVVDSDGSYFKANLEIKIQLVEYVAKKFNCEFEIRHGAPRYWPRL